MKREKKKKAKNSKYYPKVEDASRLIITQKVKKGKKLDYHTVCASIVAFKIENSIEYLETKFVIDDFKHIAQTMVAYYSPRKEENCLEILKEI